VACATVSNMNVFFFFFLAFVLSASEVALQIQDRVIILDITVRNLKLALNQIRSQDHKVKFAASSLKDAMLDYKKLVHRLELANGKLVPKGKAKQLKENVVTMTAGMKQLENSITSKAPVADAITKKKDEINQLVAGMNAVLDGAKHSTGTSLRNMLKSEKGTVDLKSGGYKTKVDSVQRYLELFIDGCMKIEALPAADKTKENHIPAIMKESVHVQAMLNRAVSKGTLGKKITLSQYNELKTNLKDLLEFYKLEANEINQIIKLSEKGKPSKHTRSYGETFMKTKRGGLMKHLNNMAGILGLDMSKFEKTEHVKKSEKKKLSVKFE
jgi:hypothetical protein